MNSMQISFQGIIPPYKISKARIYPIKRDISSAEINNICNEVLKNAKSLGEGVNGKAYYYGRDLVIKKSKTDALCNNNVMQEAEKLDILYEFMKERGKFFNLENTQQGIAAFKLNNGDSYLISSLVKGRIANPYTNPLNKKNLASLVSVITELDKGSDKYGRLMVYDLNLGNIHFTKDKAGILDFEHLKGENLDESIKNVIIDKNYGSAIHTSDTSFLDSNLRSFEFSALYDYLNSAPVNEARKLFNEYLNIKSHYHKNMAEHLKKQSSISSYPEIVDGIAKSELAHANILSCKNLSKDIIKSEAVKIQMSQFMYISSRHCNAAYMKFNPRQISEYRQKGLEFFYKKLTEALKSGNKDKIVYYTDCITVFDKWAKVDKLLQAMNDSQRKRISVAKSTTLDEVLSI